MKVLYFCLFTFVVTIGIFWWHAKSRRRTAMKLQERQDLNDDALYSRFYSDSGISQAKVIELWHEVADALNVAPGQLRPEDEFGKDIGTWSITSEDLDYLGQLALKRAKVNGRSVDLQAIKSVDDYVRALC
ncbi:hypothetical protein [Cupriavidus pauculus]|uniref:hypothetical protein n=1 Tax=Cupriavidus pauculus TaxID=82633 RepID=UPI0012FDD783|nr:hypothetical protein [Cupriavidus pauculus]MBY4730339.1 hypothetical protein [Cupriavidus pauculus]